MWMRANCAMATHSRRNLKKLLIAPRPMARRTLSHEAMVTITSWNINSVRLRMPIVARFLHEHAPDILCLQEIKCQEHEFPYADFAELGYTHTAVHGQKGYHGVATVSRIPITEYARHDWQANGEARHIGVMVGDKFALDNVYIPAGGDEPDRDINPKFGQKLDFLGRMTEWAATIAQPTMIVGDFNIAPLESDVWSHKQLLKVVSHTPIEVETLAKFQAAHDWVDLGRAMIKDPARYYTWWSYRSKNWRDGDRGRRLDHMWASKELAEKLTGHGVFEDARDWDKPSDHVPITSEIAL